MPLLDVIGLEKSYGRRKVVNGVAFDVNQGEVVGLLGPNGAGKTTSFRMTIGLVDADGGQVLFDGSDVTQLPMYKRARAGMGYLAQDSSVFKQLTVEENLMAILETRPGMNRKARKYRQDELLTQFGLAHIRKTTRQSGVRRRAASAGDRPVAHHRAQADPPRRAVRGHRPQDRRRDPGRRSGTWPRSTTSASS